jgi:hypothetical protein
MDFPARRIGAIILACISPATLLGAQHHRYRLVDLGTLGGPHSYGEINGWGIRLLNDAGVVGSFADTAQPDPDAPNCNLPDCYLAHAFRWKNGSMGTSALCRAQTSAPADRSMRAGGSQGRGRVPQSTLISACTRAARSCGQTRT